MGAKSKRKGKLGELEASKKLARLFGCQARRGQLVTVRLEQYQFGGYLMRRQEAF